MSTEEQTEVEVLSCDIVYFAGEAIECVHKEAVAYVLDELKCLTFDELADLGDYMNSDCMIVQGDKCIRFSFIYNEELVYDYANIDIHKILKKYDYIEG
jgi:hypothetical protein